MEYYLNGTLNMMLKDADNYINSLLNQLDIANSIIEEETDKKNYYKDKYTNLLKTLNKNRPVAREAALNTVEKSFNDKFSIGNTIYNKSVTEPDIQLPDKQNHIHMTDTTNSWQNNLGKKSTRKSNNTSSIGPGIIGRTGKNRNSLGVYTIYNGGIHYFEKTNHAAEWVIDTFGNKGKRHTVASNISTSTKDGKIVSGLKFYTVTSELYDNIIKNKENN